MIEVEGNAEIETTSIDTNANDKCLPKDIHPVAREKESQKDQDGEAIKRLVLTEQNMLNTWKHMFTKRVRLLWRFSYELCSIEK